MNKKQQYDNEDILKEIERIIIKIEKNVIGESIIKIDNYLRILGLISNILMDKKYQIIIDDGYLEPFQGNFAQLQGHYHYLLDTY